MPKFSEAEFDAQMEEVREYLVDTCERLNVPLDKLASAASRIGEMNPEHFAFDDKGDAARAEFRMLLKSSGMDDAEVENTEIIFKAIHEDRFKGFIGSIVYNTFVYGPVLGDPPPDWPNVDVPDRKVALGDFDYENILGDVDDDGAEVQGHYFVNPCMVSVVGPAGAAVDYAVPGWACVLAGIVVVAGAIGDSALGFLERVADGFKKAGRELKRTIKKIGKVLGL